MGLNGKWFNILLRRQIGAFLNPQGQACDPTS